MIGIQFTLTNKETGSEIKINDHVTDPNNVIALQAFPTFATDIRANDINKQGRHGVHKTPYYYGGKIISFSGIIVGESEAQVWTMKKQIDNVMKLPEIVGFDELVNISFTDPNGVTLNIGATLSAPVAYTRPLQRGCQLSFQILMRSSQPYFTVGEEGSNTVTFNGELGFETTGFKVPFIFPINMALTREKVLTVVSSGNSITRITLKGSDDGTIANPSIRNLTTGEEITLLRTLDGADDFITIDGINGTITDKSGNDIAVYAFGDDKISLLDGSNDLFYTCATSSSPETLYAEFDVEAVQFVI